MAHNEREYPKSAREREWMSSNLEKLQWLSYQTGKIIELMFLNGLLMFADV